MSQLDESGHASIDTHGLNQYYEIQVSANVTSVPLYTIELELRKNTPWAETVKILLKAQIVWSR